MGFLGPSELFLGWMSAGSRSQLTQGDHQVIGAAVTAVRRPCPLTLNDSPWEKSGVKAKVNIQC